MIKTTLTEDTRVQAIVHLTFDSPHRDTKDRDRLEVAFMNSCGGMVLRDTYAIEKDMIVVLAEVDKCPTCTQRT